MEFIKTFTQFLNEADEKEVEEVEKEEKSKKDGEELEITLNVIDDSKNLRNILKFLRGAKTDLVITCKEVDGEKETTFDWNPKKDDSILFLDVQEVDEDKSKQAEENEKEVEEDKED